MTALLIIAFVLVYFISMAITVIPLYKDWASLSDYWRSGDTLRDFIDDIDINFLSVIALIPIFNTIAAVFVLSFELIMWLFTDVLGNIKIVKTKNQKHG